MGAIEQIFHKQYIEQAQEIGANFPLWFNAMRVKSAEYMELIGVPAKGESVVDVAAMLASASSFAEPFIETSFDFDFDRVAVCNGLVNKGLTVLDNGVAFGALSTACLDYEHIVRQYFNTVADNRANFFSALNLMFIQEGAFVYVPSGVKADRTILLDNSYQEDNKKGFSRTLIVVEQGAEVDLVVRHSASKNFSQHTREIIIGKGAKVNLTEYISGESNCELVLNNYSQHDTQSELMTVFVNSSSKSSLLEYKQELSGNEANSVIKGLYLVGRDERSEVQVDMNHLVADCTSEQLIKGLAAANGVGCFSGRIYVAPNAQRTSAAQQSRNIMLSSEAKIRTLPQLEIYADDVKCSHGATVGQMNDEAVYYMRQRGISEVDARKLQLSGFINDVISNIDNSELAAYIYEQVAKKIDDL